MDGFLEAWLVARRWILLAKGRIGRHFTKLKMSVIGHLGRKQVRQRKLLYSESSPLQEQY